MIATFAVLPLAHSGFTPIEHSWNPQTTPPKIPKSVPLWYSGIVNTTMVIYVLILPMPSVIRLRCHYDAGSKSWPSLLLVLAYALQALYVLQAQRECNVHGILDEHC
ncbi:hypothetical protein BDV23DRAFT_144608 [Aspergillus alliaceus]|uniref:Uncharacterized protein n=1 Tax=Petromyces alliaceus TaxID=209559 RepID=A0A5N7CPM8_PETAA|nr:hypothetical protein BDV23DRAFT_144608 [Aspergillus alliaceus]